MTTTTLATSICQDRRCQAGHLFDTDIRANACGQIPHGYRKILLPNNENKKNQVIYIVGVLRVVP